MILSCQNICKAFGEEEIIKDACFHIEEKEKAALIGNNGAGKTTLLRIIMNELSADSGSVVISRDKKIGYLAQYQDIHGHQTIYDELSSTKQHIIDMENRNSYSGTGNEKYPGRAVRKTDADLFPPDPPV